MNICIDTYAYKSMSMCVYFYVQIYYEFEGINKLIGMAESCIISHTYNWYIVEMCRTVVVEKWRKDVVQ